MIATIIIFAAGFIAGIIVMMSALVVMAASNRSKLEDMRHREQLRRLAK